jgi:DNA primase
MTVVDDIKSQIDIVDLISESVKLRHTGKNYTGFCPFHSNTRTPAFVVFPETQTWRCFGQCNEGGDIFGFVMKKEGWDFNETLRFLADRAGVTLKSYAHEDSVDKNARERLSEVLEAAVLYYRQQMLETSPGHETLNYLHGRGLTDQTIKIFGLGYAPDGWDNLLKNMKEKGYNEQLLLDAGLTSERDSGGMYDRFRNRLTIPIRDPFGKMVGFGGRVVDPNDIPKYLNSPKTELFDKGRLLYGLDLARQNIRARDQVVIVEGYLDVIALHQAGFNNAVSPMGTALTEDQFRLVKKFTRRIVLALDADAAGEKATLRGLETARQTMDQDAELRFDARGLLHFEARLKADIRVTTLPQNKDPDEIVLEDAVAWEKIVSNAKPIVEHVMETLAAARDINDAKVKSEIAAQVLPLIEDVPDRVERETYRQKLAHLIKVDERALITPSQSNLRVNRGRGSTVSKVQNSGQLKELKRSNRVLEKYCLQYLIKNPEGYYYINRSLQNYGLTQLSDVDFLESDYLEIIRIIRASLEQDEYAPHDYVAINCPESIIDELTVEPEEKKPGKEITPEKELADITRAILRMRRHRIEEQLSELLYMQNILTEEDEELASIYQQMVIEQIRIRKKIDDALQPPSVNGRAKKLF